MYSYHPNILKKETENHTVINIRNKNSLAKPPYSILRNSTLKSNERSCNKGEDV